MESEFRSNPSTSHESLEDEISLLQFVATLLAHRRKIAACGLILPLLVIVATLLAPPNWTSAVSFMPQSAGESASPRLTSLAGQLGFDIGAASSGQSPQFYADLVESRSILIEIVEDTFEVWDTIGWNQQGRVMGTLPALLGHQSDVDDGRVSVTIDWLRTEAISAEVTTETGVVDVSVTTPWPELSQRIGQRIVELVNTFNLEARQSQAGAEREFIEGRVVEARTELLKAEERLEAFLTNNRSFQNSADLAFQHDRLRRQVSMRQQVYTSLVESYEQARIAEVRNTPVVTVIQNSFVPEKADSKRLGLKLVLALVVGMMVGVLSAFVSELIRNERAERPQEFAQLSDLWRSAKGDLLAMFRRS